MNLFDTSETSPVPGRDGARDERDPGRERLGGRAVLLVVLGLGVLVGGAWTAAYLVAGDKVPRGTTVAGVDIGGREADQAAGVLEEGLAERVSRPLAVEVGDVRERVDPERAGLTVDYDASVADAGGERTWNPVRLWDHFTGGDDRDAVVDVDETALESTLAALDAEAGTPAEDGAIVFADGRPEVTDAVVGRGIDPAAARDALARAYVSDERTVALDLVVVQPDIDADDVAAARTEFVNPAMSAPVTLVFGGSELTLRPRQYADVLLLEPQDGVLVPGLDQAALDALVDGATSADGAPVDATVALRDGRPRVVPGKPGVTYEPGAVAEVFLTAVTAPDGERRAEVASTVQEPEFTVQDARALGVREKVSEFETFFPYAEYRNTNIGRAAELIDGTLLKPGETFSLNDIVGERTVENGFVDGFVISDGVLRQDLGGGVSQMATTTFNAMFFAGLKDVEHKPHSFYIDRYPVGREATVAWGAIDLRFQNDTDHGVLIESVVTPSTPSSQGVVRVAMYSTKTWDITTSTSERYAFISPDTRYLDAPDCEPATGSPGFQVDVSRTFARPGSSDVVRTEQFHTDYNPAPTVICGPPPGAAPAGGGGGGNG